MVQSKPEIPIFEQILVEKCDKVYKNVVNIYTTEEYLEYRNFINHTLIPLITTIIGYDKDGKIYNINHTNSVGTSGDNLLPSKKKK